MHARVFAIVTAFLLGALGLGALAVTDWVPGAATAGGRVAPAVAGAVVAGRAGASASPPATRPCGPAAHCATS